MTNAKFQGIRSSLGVHRHLLSGAFWNLGARGMGAITAFGFWTLAAHLYPQSIVGGATGIYSVVQLVVFLTGAGLPLVLGRYAAGADRDSGTIYSWTLVITTALSAIGTVILFLAFRNSIRSELLDHGPVVGILAFFLAVNGFSVTAVSEVRLLVVRRARAVFLRITMAGIFPILVIAMIGAIPHDALLIATIWSAGNLIFAVGSLIVLRGPLGPHHLLPLPERTRTAARFATISMLTQITMFSPLFVLPVLVLANVSDANYAVFYLSWGVGTAAFLLPTAIGGVLLVEGGRNQTSSNTDTGVAIAVGLGFAVAAEVVSFPLALIMAAALGPEYHDIISLVPIFVAAGVPWSVTYVLVSHARIYEHNRVVWLIGVTLAIGVLGPAWPLVRAHGAAGGGVAWLGGMLLAAIVAVLLSPWRSTFRGSSTGTASA
jgi:O-antigen/teichoic acid export membrane protein